MIQSWVDLTRHYDGWGLGGNNDTGSKAMCKTHVHSGLKYQYLILTALSHP